MKKFISNFIVGIAAILGVVAKWGGAIMDLIGLPDAALKLRELAERYLSWVDGAGVFVLLGFLAVFLVLINRRGAAQEPAAKDQHQSGEIDLDDAHILQIRADVMRLAETCSGYGNPADERENVFRRRQRIQDSDHPIWLDPAMSQARRDFVHWIGVAQSDRERYGPSFETKENRNEVLFYLKDAHARLEAGLTGAKIPNELIRLTKAVSLAFDRIQATKNLSAKITLNVLSGLEKSDQQKLPSLVCQMFFNGTDIDIYGVLPPGREMRKIPKNDRDNFMFSDDASELFEQFGESKRYRELAIQRKDFERRLAELTDSPE